MMPKSRESNGKKLLFFITSLLILSIYYSVDAFPQEFADVKFIINYRLDNISQKITKEDNFSWRTTSEIKLFAMGAIRLYQFFISSQQTQVCVFTPSCSHFSMEAIKKRGFFWGGLMTADRLLRCNGLSRSYYKIDQKTNLAIDPVDDHILKFRQSSK